MKLLRCGAMFILLWRLQTVCAEAAASIVNSMTSLAETKQSQFRLIGRQGEVVQIEVLLGSDRLHAASGLGGGVINFLLFDDGYHHYRHISCTVSKREHFERMSLRGFEAQRHYMHVWVERLYESRYGKRVSPRPEK